MSGVLKPAGANWDQGDLAEGVYFPGEDRNLPGLLLTPACDIEQEKVDLWTFVALFDAETLFLGLLERASNAPLNAKEKRRLAEDLVKQRLPRYHWLPPFENRAAQVADFSNVTSIDVLEAQALPRFASLNSSWREQVPARYVAFMGRVGTQDLDEVVRAGAESLSTSSRPS